MRVRHSRGWLSAGICCALVSMGLGAAHASQISNNTPRFIAEAKKLGATDTKRTIEVTIWLKLRNRAALDELTASVYDSTSPGYRRWLTVAGFEARFAPTAADSTAVSEFFKSNGLSVVAVGPKNMWVKAKGTVAQVNKAFSVKLQDFQFKGQTLYANTVDPTVSGAAGAVTDAVYGLHNLTYSHPYVQRSIPSTSSGADAAAGRAPLTSSAPPIDSACIGVSSETETFENGGSDYPYVTVTGNAYAPKAGELGGCGYTPPEIQTAYNLNALYAEGYDGTGQTIVIIDWCGSPTILADANTFSASYGLPPLTSANFQIINSSTPPLCGGPDPEINIDVEWAHAIAPGASIDLVVPPSASFADVDTGEFFAVINGLGNVISGSYGSEELYDSPAELQTESLINEIAAARGISANFATGDEGDFTFDAGFTPSVSAPADSPYATGVGGVSVVLKPSNAIWWQSGWGTNFTPIISGGYVFDPPTLSAFFDFGSGGGPSAIFAKPTFQAKLKGTTRQLPDISWLADPFTGGVIVISEPFQEPAQIYTVYGGTSLATPMFSGLWAIANQEAGVALGQASQYVYSMPSSTITDIKPVSSTTNVTASYVESPTVTDNYTAAELAGPLENTTKFVTAIWNYPLYEDTVYVISFGTDSGLTTGYGWDDVTGVGVPSGKAFADYFAP